MAATTSQSPAPASTPAATEETEKLAFIEEITANADAVQERVLAEILGRNADSEYLLRCGLAGATDRATFRAKVPMVTYEDLRPDVMRVANGDRSPILSGSGNPVSEFFRSSGTSGGEPKLIPVVKDEFDRQLLLQSLVMAVMSRHQQPGRVLCFYFVESDTMTPGGLPAYCATTSIIKRLFSMPKLADELCRTYTSPPAAIQCEDGFQSMYAQMLCGLCHRHAVRRVESLFALAVVRAISFLQLNWRQLAGDIESGTLSPSVTDPALREAVAGVLRPDQELAEFIRTECGKGDDWAGIVTRIWPNAGCLATIATGAMAQYVPALNHYSGGLPIASVRYAASECGFGLNLRPLCDPSEVSYTIIPNLAYFEFLPVGAGAEATASELVELAGVEAGREYETVVTTYGGLSRFRVGDVLRVAGFHNSSPRLQFVGRRNVLLSVDTDKTDEAELQRAVERASTLLHPHGAAVQDYTSRASTASVPGHYIVYWELRLAAGVDGDVLGRCCLEMEEALGYEYRCLRVRDGSIGPLEIRVVRTGTFEKLADYATSHGGPSIGRYKVPRSVTNPAIIQLLDSRVVSSHFSPALPHWTPDQLFQSDREKCPGFES